MTGQRRLAASRGCLLPIAGRRCWSAAARAVVGLERLGAVPAEQPARRRRAGARTRVAQTAAAGARQATTRPARPPGARRARRSRARSGNDRRRPARSRAGLGPAPKRSKSLARVSMRPTPSLPRPATASSALLEARARRATSRSRRGRRATAASRRLGLAAPVRQRAVRRRGLRAPAAGRADGAVEGAPRRRGSYLALRQGSYSVVERGDDEPRQRRRNRAPAGARHRTARGRRGAAGRAAARSASRRWAASASPPRCWRWPRSLCWSHARRAPAAPAEAGSRRVEATDAGRDCRAPARRRAASRRAATVKRPRSQRRPSARSLLDRGIFRAYDIRGVVGKTLDAGIAELIGQSIGSLMQRARACATSWSAATAACPARTWSTA